MIGAPLRLKQPKDVLVEIDDRKALLRWPILDLPVLDFFVKPQTFDKKRDVLCRMQSTGTNLFLNPYRGDFKVEVRMLMRPHSLELMGRYQEFGRTIYAFRYHEPRKYVVLEFHVMFPSPNPVLDKLLGLGE